MRRTNPNWQVDGFRIEIEREVNGTWSYKTILAEDGTLIENLSGYASEDDALRDAMEELTDSADYQQLEDGHELWREPDYEGFNRAVWWGPGDTMEQVESVTVADDAGCVTEWSWVGDGSEWIKRTVCPEPSPSSARLRAGVAAHMFSMWGADEEEASSEDFAYEFSGVIPTRAELEAAAADNPGPIKAALLSY